MKYFQDQLEEKHLTIVNFFLENRFGSNLPILTYLSTLEPLDRCIILETLLARTGGDIILYDKLVLAYVKNGRVDLAEKIIELAKSKKEANQNITGLQEKLMNIAPPPKRNDQERLLMFNNYLGKTIEIKEIQFLNLLIQFIGIVKPSLSFTEQFLNANEPLHFVRVPSADTIQFPYFIGSNQYEKRILLPSGYIIKPSGQGSYPGLIIPYLDELNREYLLYYISETLTSEKFGEMRKLVTLREKSSYGEIPFGPENKIRLKDADMTPDGDYFYSGRDFRGYGAEYLNLLETEGVRYLFPQYMRKK